ncbi:plancitoxin-1-like [Uranotaenia lowii]|uniref:plancitoxin-1-like n=1 Tax=Uranotaenia lowii TaxID=190385 RepID=UPI00247A5464|nr:plancitoxin-1-like [Uranotaenia lowii]
MMLRFLSIFAIYGLLISTTKAEIGCRDENNKLVDWYYLYKLPETNSHDPESGLYYSFITSDNADNPEWKRSKHNVNQAKSVPGRTLEPILKDAGKQFLSVLYNDEPPTGKTDGYRGHTKGVVATDGITGFWLVHSVPKYPPALGEAYQYPHTGRMYGQSFLCITFNASEMNTIGMQLNKNEPHVYSSGVPNGLKAQFPDLVEAISMKNSTEAPHWSHSKLISRNGVVFRSFAKDRNFRKELYADFIAPTLQVALFVESWQHGTGNLPSNCNIPELAVLNVKSVKVGDAEFTTLKDHSKWAVTGPGDSSFWICVGDINRQEHQKLRGGGSVCTESTGLSSVYFRSVVNVEECPLVRN